MHAAEPPTLRAMIPGGKFYILDEENRPVEADVLTWGRFFQGHRRWVGFTFVTSEVSVSTIFIGVDHRHYGEGPPLLFETMIFGGPLDQHHWRYASWDDADTGHKVAVRKARKAIGQKVSDDRDR
jgi:hypothetical protein